MGKKSFADLIKDIFKPPAAGTPSPSDKRMDRRRFFRAGLAEMLKPLDVAIRPLEQVANQVAKLEEIPQYRPPRSVVDRPWVRPPGALPEMEFRLRCTRCGDCVNACPVAAIRVDHSGEEGASYPYIEVNEQPCVMCDGQPCMPACPAGALQIVAPAAIDIGTAFYFDQACLRSNGDDCTVCVDHCPVGTAALELKDGNVVVHEEGCTGCGVCQYDCPTDPKSIVVIPKSSRQEQ